MADASIVSEFGKGDFGHKCGVDPMRTTRLRLWHLRWCSVGGQRGHRLGQIRHAGRVEPGADLAFVDELASLILGEQQG